MREAKSLVGLNRCSSQPDVCSRTLQRAPVSQSGLTDWQLKFTGIPVVLLDTGATKSRTQRRIQLILAERGTGFTLWRDTIDNLSNYEVNFHFYIFKMLRANFKFKFGALNFHPANSNQFIVFIENVGRRTNFPHNEDIS